MSALIVALALVGRIDHDSALKNHVEIIELNHCFTNTGGFLFDQYIFWEWNSARRCYQIVDFRMAASIPHKPYLNQRRNYVLIFSDWRTKTYLREVTSPIFRETWTRFDPEQKDRTRWPMNRRRKLVRPPLIRPPAVEFVD